jgi:hypothetical protein
MKYEKPEIQKQGELKTEAQVAVRSVTIIVIPPTGP